MVEKTHIRPRLLDLFCCAGGAGMGYHRAGFEVVGVDIAEQSNYPFEFEQGDALEYLAAHGREFDAIHASPPCQSFTAYRRKGHGVGDGYLDLIPQNACGGAAVGLDRSACARRGRRDAYSVRGAAMKSYWVCVAHRWAVPTVECDARGETYTAGDKHCTDTGHPIVTTTRLELADRLAGSTAIEGSAA